MPSPPPPTPRSSGTAFYAGEILKKKKSGRAVLFNLAPPPNTPYLNARAHGRERGDVKHVEFRAGGSNEVDFGSKTEKSRNIAIRISQMLEKSVKNDMSHKADLEPESPPDKIDAPLSAPKRSWWEIGQRAVVSRWLGAARGESKMPLVLRLDADVRVAIAASLRRLAVLVGWSSKPERSEAVTLLLVMLDKELAVIGSGAVTGCPELSCPESLGVALQGVNEREPSAVQVSRAREVPLSTEFFEREYRRTVESELHAGTLVVLAKGREDD